MFGRISLHPTATTIPGCPLRCNKIQGHGQIWVETPTVGLVEKSGYKNIFEFKKKFTVGEVSFIVNLWHDLNNAPGVYGSTKKRPRKQHRFNTKN
jgi:hypothetical protein